MTNQSIQTYIYEIKNTLTKFAADRETQATLDDGKYRRVYHTRDYWTPNVMRRIGCIGKGEGFVVRADWFVGRPADWSDPKRLYDLYWVGEDDKSTKTLPLALECEWDHDSTNRRYNIKKYRPKIEEDFDKLLQSSAALRVMIFECWCPNEPSNVVKDRASEEIDNLIYRIEAFSDRQSEANYLFCVHCTYKDGNKFIFRRYPHEGG